MKILCVDDDDIVLRLLSEVLARAGYGDVVTTSSPVEALKLLRSAPEPFECILLDIQMPEMDGITLCGSIRSLPAYRNTPILMLTALGDKTFVDRAFHAGATDYLTKPFDATEVAMRVGFAGQLVSERKVVAENALVIDSFIEVLDQTNRHDLNEALDLGKIKGLIPYPVFENYLYQAGRSVIFLASVFSVKVRNVQNWHLKLTPLEFREMLRRSAVEIISALVDFDIFLSYRGDGEFVGVLPRSGYRGLKDLGETLQIDMEESEGRFGAHLPQSVTLVLGDPISVRLPTRGGLVRSVWSALENVREKSEPAKSGYTDDGSLLVSRNARAERHQEKAVRERRLKAEFKQLLRDELKAEIGEHGRRKAQSEPAKNGPFQLGASRPLLVRSKDKSLFGRKPPEGSPAKGEDKAKAHGGPPSGHGKPVSG